MRAKFWNTAWGEGNIGFHQADIHRSLEKHWPTLEAGSTVLVPLCGKSSDILWLEAQGLDVIGVEFVESAVRDFFRENNLSWQEIEQYGHRCYRANERNIRIFVTDFIQLADDYTGQPVISIYDRAALVALPKDMRGAYVAACRKFLVDSPRGVLVSLKYEPEVMQGPPFSVPPDEVDHLWKGDLVLVEQVDSLSTMPRAMEAGVQTLDEYFWVLR